MKRLTRLAQSAASSRRSSTVDLIASESYHRPDKDVPTKKCIASSKSPLYHLPTELFIEILSNLVDLASLGSAVLSCKALYHSYLTAPHLILSVVTARDVGICQVDADAVASFDPCHFREDETHISGLSDLIDTYRTALGHMPLTLHDSLSPDFFEREMPERIGQLRRTIDAIYQSERTTQVVAETNLHSMTRTHKGSSSTLHSAVRIIANAFCKDVIPLIPGVGSDIQKRYSLTSEEEYRLFRALYRFELYCRIFCCEKYRAFKLSSEEKALLFLSIFTLQEAEEIACVYLYIHQVYKKILADLDRGNIYG